MSDPQTIPQYLVRAAETMGTAPAIREKNLGIWQTHDWNDYSDQVRRFAAGLSALGFGRDDKLSVIGNNRPRLYWAQVAAMCVGGQAVPVYQDAIANELAFVLQHAEVKVIVAENQEQVDKILSIRDQLPALQWLIYDYERGLARYDESILISFQAVQAKGTDTSAVDQAIASGTAEDVAIICYTSGTTGNPKGVMLNHANLVQTAKIFLQHEDVRRDDDLLSYLPMAWVGDALYGLVVSLMVGCATNCPEEPETVLRDLRELGPTGIVAPPRVWDGMLTSLQVRGGDSSPLKKAVYNYFIDVAVRIENLKFEGKPVSGGLKLMHALGEFLVYAPIRDQLGLRRARWCYTGGAPLGPDTFRFFRGLGVNLKQVYGSTELTGLASLQPNTEANPDTVGPPCREIEVRIDDDRGEVLVRSAGVFRGYYKEPEKTAEAIDADGWFHTGDAGLIDGKGHLVIVDRAKDVGRLHDGTPFTPQFIELKLKFSPFINEAVAFGDGHPFVSTMIAIDYETVGKWAERQAMPYTNYMDLSQRPEVRELVAEEIRKINLGLPEALRIKRFLLLSKDLDADDNEITRTRKLRRGYIAEKYAPVIDAFYGGGKDVELTLDVTFEDGSQSSLNSRMQIEEAA
ncbi:MAG: AMP-binding protein [Alphaproteobacteria bacterium]